MTVRVMVIDDEFIILDGLASFPWEKYGCELVATAQNGAEGLAKMAEFTPDLVFTDIQMPEMNGLTFAAKAREQNEKIRVILLTGYDNFEFAQEAIRAGVRDYLLKPMNFMKMDELLKKVCAEIADERELDKYYMDLQKNFQKELPYIRSKFISDLLHGRIRSAADMTAQSEIVGIRIEKYVAAAISEEAEKTADPAADAWPEQFALLNIGEEVLKEFCPDVLCEYDDLRLQFNFLLLFDGTSDDAECSRLAVEACEKLKDVAQQVLHFRLCIGISAADTAMENVHEKYREACAACGQSAYLGDSTIVRFEDLTDAAPSGVSITEGQKQRLFMKIYSGRTQEVGDELRELFTPDAGPLDDLKFAALDLLVDSMQYPSLCRIPCDILKSQYDFSFLYDGIKVIKQAESAEDIAAYLEKGFRLLAAQNSRDTDDRYAGVVNEIVHYMQTHYQEDLTLDSIADQFHMSKTYVSRLLKKYRNNSFLRILVDIRMEQARKMILESHYKINEIAERTGYNDFSYFIQAFKKQYGVTPNEYRKTI